MAHAMKTLLQQKINFDRSYEYNTRVKWPAIYWKSSGKRRKFLEVFTVCRVSEVEESMQRNFEKLL